MTATNAAAGETSQLLRDSADTLEDAEVVLHRSAEVSPRLETTRRLQALDDAVTAEAHSIIDPADRLDTDDDAQPDLGPHGAS